MIGRPETHSRVLYAMPPEHQVLEMERYFAPDEVVALSRGYRPRGHKHKWLVALDEDSGRLRFYRHERGFCIYEMLLEPLPGGEGAVGRQLVVNRNQAQHYCWCDEDEVRMCNYLIDLLLLNRGADFPLPLGGPKAELAIAEPGVDELPQADNDTDVLLHIEAHRQQGRQRIL